MYAKLLSQYAAMSQGQRPAGQWAREVSEGATAFEWQCSEHLQPGDRLNCRKLPRVPGVAGISSIPLAALLGTYIAEGNVSYCKDNPNIVVYTVNAADWAVRGVPAAVEAYWPDVTCNLEPKKNSKVSFSILVNSSELARWCVRLHGSGVWNKTIPAELLNATNEAKREFMGRWLDGDGWCDKKGGHWSSCNYGLIMQGRDLLLTLGIAASIYKIDHAKCETSGYQGSGIEYTLNVSNFDLETLVGHSQKISNNPYLRSAKEKKKEHQVCLYPVGDTTAYRVKSIGITEAENVDVWNFEVEYDHSYSLAGVISHNCTVPNDECSSCGNLAPTREEYCLGEDEGGHCKHGGCRNRLTRVCEDGHVLHVDNPDPTFIDFSNVVRPADRIAYGGMADYLMKAASGSAVGGAELAEQIGLTVPLDIAFSYAMRGRPHVEPQFKLACAFAVLEQSVPVSPVYGATPAAQFSTAQLGKPGTTKFAEALTALADEGIILPLHTFCELWSGDAKVEKAAQVALTGIYTRLIRSADFPEKLAGHIFQPARTTTSAAKTWARKQAADFSVLPEHIENRRWLAALNGTTDNNFVKSKQASDITESASSAADGMQIAERYAVYKLAALCKIAELTDDFALTAVTALHQNHH
jgi:hypothetical protein